MEFLAELKRRNVHRMAGLYLVAAWLVVQVAETIFPLFGFGDAPARITVIILAIGFVPALLFAWVFEITPEGLKRESEIDRTLSITPQTGRRMDRLIIGVLVAALIYFALDKFVIAPQREAARLGTATEVARVEGRAEAIVESYGDKSIAVLPFADMSAAKDQEYMADGLAEEVLNLLAQIPELRVISRSSAFSFKGQHLEVPEIAKRLSVANILEGSVRKSGNTIRVTAQLIDARTDTHLWSETYDRPLDDIFVVQDEIAAAVVTQLKLKLLGALPKAKVADPEAYALYLQSRALGRQGTPEDWERSIALAQQALARDPGLASAWNQLAIQYSNQAGYGLRPISEGYSMARAAAEKALALDPTHAPAHANIAWIAMHYDGDLAQAAQHFQQALVLAPGDTRILGDAAILALSLGRLAQAIAIDEYVVARDPMTAFYHFSLGMEYRLAGRFDESIASYRRALQLAPSYVAAQSEIGLALLAQGQTEAALVEALKEHDIISRLHGLSLIYFALGRQADSDAALAELISKHPDAAAYNIAFVYSGRGEVDNAFVWLEKAAANKDPGLAEIVTETLFDNVRSDPRWLPFLRKLGKAPEQLAAIPFEVKLPQ